MPSGIATQSPVPSIQLRHASASSLHCGQYDPNMKKYIVTVS